MPDFLETRLSSDSLPISTEERIVASLRNVKVQWLVDVVQTLSVPRHYDAEQEANRRIGSWLKDQFAAYGYESYFQGNYNNILTRPKAESVLLIGAHFDSVPECPGADDNASAVAAMLSCARSVAGTEVANKIVFAAFNREEDGLLGSDDYARHHLDEAGYEINAAIILEMVGYRDTAPGSQSVPEGLPVKVPSVGDFLAVVSDERSRTAVDGLLSCARAYTPELPVLGLELPAEVRGVFPDLLRSDHLPLWSVDVPAMMWTDTSEFRNPNYHHPTDTPDTLDYEYLRSVTRVLTAFAHHFVLSW